MPIAIDDKVYDDEVHYEAAKAGVERLYVGPKPKDPPEAPTEPAGASNVDDRRDDGQHLARPSEIATGILNNIYGYYPPLAEVPPSELGKMLGVDDIKLQPAVNQESPINSVIHGTVDMANFFGKIGQAIHQAYKGEEVKTTNVIPPDVAIPEDTDLGAIGKLGDKLLGRGRERIQLFPERMARDFIDSLAVPHDVWQGTLDPNTPDGFARVTNLAWNMVNAPRPIASRLADGTLGSFAGVTSKTLDKTKLYKAQNMELEQAHPDEIWKETGFFRGADNRWRYEIPDANARLRKENLEVSPATEDKGWTSVGKEETLKVPEYEVPLKLEDIYHHPELFKAYPKLKDIEVHPMPKGKPYDDYSGMISDGKLYMNELHERDWKSTIAHELQHVIQVGEGFNLGGSPHSFTPPKLHEARKFFEETRANTEKELASEFKTPNAIGPIKRMIEQELEFGSKSLGTKEQLLNDIKTKKPEVYERLSNIVKSERLLRDQEAKQFTQYKRLAGEVESRNVQRRLEMGVMERMLKNPITTEDTPRHLQVVRQLEKEFK